MNAIQSLQRIQYRMSASNWSVWLRNIWKPLINGKIKMCQILPHHKTGQNTKNLSCHDWAVTIVCVNFRFRGVWSHIPHYTGPEIKFTQFRQMNIVVKVILPVLYCLLYFYSRPGLIGSLTLLTNIHRKSLLNICKNDKVVFWAAGRCEVAHIPPDWATKTDWLKLLK